MLDIAVCDDDRYQTGELEAILYALGERLEVSLEVDVFESGEALLREISRGKRYDIIYLDIEMGKMDGLETAEYLRVMDRTVPLVYVTSHESYMIHSFDVTPSGYIIKPVDKDKFEKIFLRISRVVGDQDQYYRFSYRKSDYKVRICDILYFESNRRTVDIVWEGGRYCTYAKMADIEAELSNNTEQFLRIHRSYLVSYKYIRKINAKGVILIDGTELPISKSRRKEVDEKMMKMMKG